MLLVFRLLARGGCCIDPWNHRR